MRGLFLQIVVELCFEIIRLLLVQIGVNDLWNNRTTDPMSEDGLGQGVDGFGFGRFKDSDLGGLVGEGHN